MTQPLVSGALPGQSSEDVMRLESFIRGKWSAGQDLTEVHSAVTGDVVALASSGGFDMREILGYGRTVGGRNLRQLTFHQRAALLKKLAEHLGKHKEQLYKLSFQTGTTRTDAMIDVDGGIGTLLAYAGKGRRELPNSKFLLDGDIEGLSKTGTFVGQHIVMPLRGVAVHINAFNFPCWGMLEKLAPALLAGVPVVTKPATVTSYVAHELVRMIVASGVLPEGALQFVVGSTGDLFDHLTCQDVVSFTGSADTSQKLQRHPVISREAVRFIAERDSLNAAILAPDATPGSPEFDLFVKEVAKEMTVKAGQKCTAIRRALAPTSHIDAVISALRERLSKVTIGNPELDTVRMGPLVGLAQRRDVLANLAKLRTEAKIVAGETDNFRVIDADAERGAFLPPILLHCPDPRRAINVHEIEAFGPICTIMGYDGLDDAIALANRGGGSLVASVYTHDTAIAAELTFGIGSFHGRMIFIDRDCAKEQTGHGSPMPQMVHGGPGRAGGGEELGGVRSLHHYMQRSALQGSPSSPASRNAGQRARLSSTATNIPSAITSRIWISAGPSSRRNARSRSTISSTSPTSPATRSTLTWTRKRPRDIPSFRAASRMDIFCCRSRPVCSSIPTTARYWPITAWTRCAS